MSEIERWQQTNDVYLSRALHWLRLKLTQRIQPAEPLSSSDPTPKQRSWFSRPFGTDLSTPASPSSQAIEVVNDDSLDNAEIAMAAAADISPPPALIQLANRFGLSDFEQQVLLLCAGMELDTRMATLCARVQGMPDQGYPTFALALSLFDNPAWDVMSPERPLRYWRMLDINQPGAQPLTTSPLRADERIVNYIKGLNYLDDRLALLFSPLELSGMTQLPDSLAQQVNLLVDKFRAANLLQRPAYIQLVGSDPMSKQLVAQHTAAELGLALYRLPLDLLPTQLGDLETFSRLWQRESGLLGFTLLIDLQTHDLGQANSSTGMALRQFLARNQMLLFLSTREVQQGLMASSVAVDVEKPNAQEQRDLWQQALGDIVASSPSQLAGQFKLTPVAIQQIVQEVLHHNHTHPDQLHDRLWQRCLTATRPQLDLLAQRLEPKATWDELVLPVDETELLHQIADQVRSRSTVYQDWGFDQKMNRGLGISALFAGESGTGKTMAAEVLANELRLNLYRIDLSSVVSKYIGETEKNLRRLFDAAEDGGAILFFDEADALFGKRSEVKDSHDRYANIEINYLLQRIEAYSGLAILATNMKSSMDPAFMRRLRFIVSFPFPAVKERLRIWQKVFPPQTPTAQFLDFKRLARLNLTGGSIHNVALNAAFLAASKQVPVSMPLVLLAARTEFRKLGKPIEEAEFRWQLPPAPEVVPKPVPPPRQVPVRRRR